MLQLSIMIVKLQSTYCIIKILGLYHKDTWYISIHSLLQYERHSSTCQGVRYMELNKV